VFSNLFNLFTTKKPSERIDRSLGFVRINEFRNYLLTEAYDKFERGYDFLHWADRTFLVEGCCAEPEYADAIERWSKTHRESQQAHLFMGVMLTYRAWHIRTAQTADKLSAVQKTRFRDTLQIALEHLEFSDEVNPNDPEICARIIRVLMGLGAAEDIVERWFMAAKAMETNHLQAHIAMLTYLAPKWHGNSSLMYGFANKHYMASDKGILSVLPLYAMVEEWLFLGINGETEAHTHFFKEGYRRTYILQVQAKFIEYPETAALSPIFYNYLAFLLLQIGEPELVRAIAPNFVLDKMTEFPWAYIHVNTPPELVKTLRI
jgi:Domain of unknown function (DUF4034)